MFTTLGKYLIEDVITIIGQYVYSEELIPLKKGEMVAIIGLDAFKEENVVNSLLHSKSNFSWPKIWGNLFQNINPYISDHMISLSLSYTRTENQEDLEQMEANFAKNKWILCLDFFHDIPENLIRELDYIILLNESPTERKNIQHWFEVKITTTESFIFYVKEKKVISLSNEYFKNIKQEVTSFYC